MADASAHLPAYIDIVARHDPGVREIEIPSRLSDSVTLSTMHGCPPDEIERISAYLLGERGLHTSVKCNPTLLGAEQVRAIVNGSLGYVDVPIPDEAFGHDLRYADAVPMFRNLQALAAERGLTFGLKLSNTLEVENWRTVFDRDPTMYLSGRALHAVTVNLAATLADEFRGELMLSFAGGADCFNVADLLAAGMSTVTVCSDLLKTGGYLRMLQYMEHVEAAFDGVGALDIDDFACRSAVRRADVAAFATLLVDALAASGIAFSAGQATGLLDAIAGAGDRPAPEAAVAWALDAGFDDRDSGDDRRPGGAGPRPPEPAGVRRRGPNRLALPEGLLPDGPLEDAAASSARSTASRRPASTSARSTSRSPST